MSTLTLMAHNHNGCYVQNPVDPGEKKRNGKEKLARALADRPCTPWDNSLCIHDISLALIYANVCQFCNFPGSNRIAFCAHLKAAFPFPAIASNGRVSFISVMSSSEEWISRIACVVRRLRCCKINDASSRRSCTFDGSACNAFWAILVACSTSP